MSHRSVDSVGEAGLTLNQNWNNICVTWRSSLALLRLGTLFSTIPTLHTVLYTFLAYTQQLVMATQGVLQAQGGYLKFGGGGITNKDSEIIFSRKILSIPHQRYVESIDVVMG